MKIELPIQRELLANHWTLAVDLRISVYARLFDHHLVVKCICFAYVFMIKEKRVIIVDLEIPPGHKIKSAWHLHFIFTLVFFFF